MQDREFSSIKLRNAPNLFLRPSEKALLEAIEKLEARLAKPEAAS